MKINSKETIMSNRRKPIRQMSLTDNDAPNARRKGLKKQFSEDVPESREKWIPELGLSVSLCPKNPAKILDRPPPAKLAWIENQQDPPKTEDGIVANKYKEIKRPITAKIPRQTSLNKDSILLSHQELAERLRQAWKDREKGKQNLNIFLAHNVKEKQEDEFTNDLTDNEDVYHVKINQPKIILPLNPETTPSKELNYKNIFQKRMRRAHSIEEPLTNLAYSPSRNLETRSRAVVIVPLAESNGPEPVPTLNKIPNKKETGESKPIDVIIRPMTASAKREVFKSRVNSAFSHEIQRPPLIRASSVPLKQIQSKPKFTPVKRRVKSATKRKEKHEKSIELKDYELTIAQDDDDDKEEGKNERRFPRCVSASAADIITMVSLVSPEESESEEHVDAEKEKPNLKIGSPAKNVSKEKHEKLEHQKNFTLRKAVKSVSFQQSSIYAVRSFSASFPARRGSVVTALMLNGGGSGTAKTAIATLEKRATGEHVPDDGREPKRRLVRTKSAPHERSLDEKDEENPRDPVQPKNAESIKQSRSNDNIQKPPQNRTMTETEEIKDEGGKIDSEENPNSELVFDTPKEKQCWNMYCKMSEKGVNISFDTILRGMLTPTEYRLRRKSAVVIDNEENPLEGRNETSERS